ncbi:hypothetical protein CWI75_00250 [Kineobactrum sediminis]|uniref:DUF1622 domain-containing protein n=1 Tax=Kineobactrum sediminis TaxID=1905677 RepID=A0A2N5Y612_9GAMM|nr:DUF1622 domain-containing protein [Kineobactrum sediminis]PLW83834.1 hypothetical protein CWI75_00250 [Kineobactrum sediminis]
MQFTDAISLVVYAIEGAGVAVVIIGAMYATLSFVRNFRRMTEGFAYQVFRRQFGRAIILGLEFLIAGDIVQTIIVTASMENVLILGLIVIIRTFLSMTLQLEVEGHWPWQKKAFGEHNK